MKKINFFVHRKFFLTVSAFVLISSLSFAQDLTATDESVETSGQTETQEETQDDENLNPNTGFPNITEHPFVVFDYGLSMGWATRIQKQTGRSNFVFGHTLLGAYATMETVNVKPCDSVLRLAAYYPVANTFNEVPQIAKQPILYAFDLAFMPLFRTDMWNYVKINFAPGLHVFYQLTDDWHFIQTGIIGMLGVELPIAKRWTILANGLASFDYANLGSNRDMFPIDWAWTYQVSLGVRYSKKLENKYSYIGSKKKVKAEKKPVEKSEPESPEMESTSEPSETDSESK